MDNDNVEGISYKRGIKDIAKDDRPREKALKHGIGVLTPAELLAILLGSGTAKLSVLDVSQELLKANDFKLSRLAKRTIGDLKKQRGVGEVRAITILAAMQLGRLMANEDNGMELQPSITDSSKAYSLMKYEIGHLTHEEFWVVALNTAKKMIGKYRVSIGSMTATIADPKLIVKWALDNMASCLVLYHNHPSGNTKPSLQDDAITQKITRAASYLDIPVIDHIIVCEHNFYSYADNGKI